MGSCLIERELQILWEISKADLPKQLPPEVAETFIHYFETTYLSEENQNFYIGRIEPRYGNINT